MKYINCYLSLRRFKTQLTAWNFFKHFLAGEAKSSKDTSAVHRRIYPFIFYYIINYTHLPSLRRSVRNSLRESLGRGDCHLTESMSRESCSSLGSAARPVEKSRGRKLGRKSDSLASERLGRYPSSHRIYFRIPFPLP